MSTFRFETAVIVEASSEEDALRQVANRIAAVARHLGNGAALADNKPFFKLAAVDRGSPTDLRADPIVAAREAERVAAENAEADRVAAEAAGDGKD